MKLWRILVTVWAVMLFTGFAFAGLAQEPASAPVQAEQAAKSASGKVVSVTPTSLSVEVQESGQARTLDFIIDSNTTVEGKVAKDASVQVTYRIEEGRNIATRVRVLG